MGDYVVAPVIHCPHFSKNVSRPVSAVISGHNETVRALAP